MKRLSTSFLLVALACTFGLLGGGIVMYLRGAEASRNSSGTYSLATSPVTTLQTISTSLWNNTFADLATGVTDSLDRNGRGGMLAALRGIDGTVAAPALSFTSETGTGYYRIGASDLGLSINSTKTGEWTANGLRVANGVVATPSLSFFNDTGSGLYRAGSNDLRFAVNGTDSTFWNANGFALGAAPISKYPFDVQKISGANHARFGSYLTLMGSAPQLGFNLYNDGSNKYMNTGIAGYLSFDLSNYFIFYTAPSGSADAVATITERMRINTSGVTVANALTVSGTAAVTGATTATGGMTIGASGTATTQMNFGSCVTNAGTPSVCTATVASGAKCVANLVGTSASTDSVTTSVSSTTLTITVQNGVAKTANYICF